MLDDITTSNPHPIVTILEVGSRYTSAMLLSAFQAAQSVPKATHHKSCGTKTGTTAVDPGIISEAIKHLQIYESNLWTGIFTEVENPLTGERSSPSQSEADLKLAGIIARMGVTRGIPEANLPDFTEAVFNCSALAQRDKWQTRPDYRERTIQKACSGLPLAPPQSVLSASTQAKSVEPDWSLKLDVLAARYFSDLLVDELKFVPAVGKWIKWDHDQSKWGWCELGEEIDASKNVVLDLYRKACLRVANHPEFGQKLITEVGGLQRENRIKAVLELAKSEPGMSVNADQLDAHPKLLGVKNGVVDLRKGTLMPNEPGLLITKYVDIDYVPNAAHDVFDQFLDAVFEGDQSTIDAVQRLAGLTITGLTSEEIMVFCVGNGANGKSIFGNVLAKTLGSYAVTAPPSLLAARRGDDHGPRPDLAMLHGARLVSINELPGGMLLDETVAKQLAGREPISARHLHREFFSFLPTFTPWVRTNHKPIIKDTSNGIWRRIVIIPFKRTFAANEQDQHLEHKLIAESNGILAWMVDGAAKYIKHGITQSPSMRAEVSSFRDESDLLGEFLHDTVVFKPTAEVRQADLYIVYKNWCERNGLRPTSKKSFTSQLDMRGVTRRKSGINRFYVGLELITQ